MQKYLLKKGGYIFLYTSSQLKGYSFPLFQKVGEIPNLGHGDIYAVNIPEPGIYTAQHTAAKSKLV